MNIFKMGERHTIDLGLVLLRDSHRKSKREGNGRSSLASKTCPILTKNRNVLFLKNIYIYTVGQFYGRIKFWVI